MNWYADEMGKSNVDVLISMVDMVTTIDVTPYLERIRTPALGLHPSGGRRTGPEKDKIKRSTPGIRFVQMPMEYHAIQCLMPSECSAEVLRFVTEHDTGAGT